MFKFCKERFFCDSGSDEKPVYSSCVEKDGSIHVSIVGFDSRQEKIDSFKESCSIDLIIARCARGDMSGLSARQGVYADCTILPRTHAEVLQAVIDGERYFNSLPIAVKEAFGNDFKKWFAQTGQQEWFEKMGISAKDVLEKPIEKPVENVKEEGVEK